MRILLVDDETICRVAITRGIEARGHQVVGCEDAQTAFTLYKQEHFDWVLTDFQMPGYDGIWLCEQIKDENRFQSILIQTSDPLGAKRKLGRSLNGLITDIPIIGKPYTMQNLEDKLGLKPPMKVFKP
jgi:CheY-like chemotaxis protein